MKKLLALLLCGAMLLSSVACSTDVANSTSSESSTSDESKEEPSKEESSKEEPSKEEPSKEEPNSQIEAKETVYKWNEFNIKIPSDWTILDEETLVARNSDEGSVIFLMKLDGFSDDLSLTSLIIESIYPSVADVQEIETKVGDYKAINRKYESKSDEIPININVMYIFNGTEWDSFYIVSSLNADSEISNNIINSICIENTNDSTVIKSTSTSKPTSEPTSTTTTGEKNALSKAKSYLKYSAFSYAGLIEQLEYEEFSTKEATYGADNCGADWMEQAVLKSESYLEIMSFSKQGLIDQLEFEGFTSEQANHGANETYK